MPRSVKEWIGATPDTPVPPRVRLRIWRKQCAGANFAICPLSGLPIRDTDEKHLDHATALIDGGEHRESNLRFVHVEAHKAKTTGEVARKARVDASAKRHFGMRSRGPLAGADKDERDARRAARSADRRGSRLDLPPRRLLPGFVSASET